jgi:hypothetical protein
MNPKFEIRNPKQYQNPKGRKPHGRLCGRSRRGKRRRKIEPVR